MRRVVILANGAIRDVEFHKKLLKESDFIICVDGGVQLARRLGVRPGLLLGDLDSLGEDVRAWLAGGQTRCETHPAEKDFTDTHLAVAEAIAMRPEEVLLLGCMGDRLDHTLANISLLLHCHRAGIPARLVDELNEAILISETVVTLRGEPGERLSLLPLSDRVSGITLEGVKYRLENETLEMGESRGVSNEFEAREAVLTVGRGYLLLIRSRGA